MKRAKMSQATAEAIEKLNETLEKLEYRLLDISKEYLEEVKAQNPDDYELELIFEFCAGEEEVASWFVSMKHRLEDPMLREMNWGIASGADHNVALEEALRGQKHCWLLHLLYDDIYVAWEQILRIDWFWAEFCLYFQYDFDLSGVKNIEELKERLLEIQKKLLGVAKSIRRKARKRVLSGNSNLFDYNLVLDITLFDKKDREYGLPQEGFKFDDPFGIWTGFRGETEGRIFINVEYQFEGLGLDMEKLLEFKELWADLILKYSYRFSLKDL